MPKPKESGRRVYSSPIGPEPQSNISTPFGEAFSTPSGKISYPQSFTGTSGGGAKPLPTPAQQVKEIAKEAKQVRSRAKAAGVSPQVQLRREIKETAQGIRQRALSAGVSPQVQATREAKLLKQGLDTSPLPKNYYDKALEAYKVQSRPVNLNLQSETPPILNKNKSISKVYQTIYKVLDVYSGGRLTEKKLDKLQGQLNKQVEQFNNKYGKNQTLSQQGYNEAISQYNSYVALQNSIDKAKEGKDAQLKKLINASNFKGSSSQKSLKILGALGLRTDKSYVRQRATVRSIGGATAISNAIINTIDTPGLVLGLIKNPKKIINTIDTPEVVLGLIKNPKNIPLIVKGLPSKFKKKGVKYFEFAKINPDYAIGRLVTSVGIQYLSFKVTDKGFKYAGKITKSAAIKTVPYFRYKSLETEALGNRIIKNIPKVGDLEVVRPKGTELLTNPESALLEANLQKQLKKNPSLATPNSLIEKKIINIVKKEGDAISGSYSQESLLKNKFTTKHKDLDILTSSREKLLAKIKKEIPGVEFKKLKASIEIRYRGKPIADVVEYAKGEAGFVKRYALKKVQGLNLIDPQARLLSKVYQLGKLGERVRGKKGAKILRDIKNLYGHKVNLKKPSIVGAYGYTKKELGKYVGKSGALATAQQDLFKSIRENLIGLKQGKASAKKIISKDLNKMAKDILDLNPNLKNEKWLYASPFNLKTGKAQIRITRLGLREEGNILDLLSRKISFGKSKPEIYIFPKEKIYKAPLKLSKGKTISTPSGFVVPKFTSELEVVLGKGYAIKKGKRLATTYIKGESVPIYELKKIKLSKSLREDIKNIKKLNNKISKSKNKAKIKNTIKDLNKKELNLNRKLKRETGLSYSAKTSKYYPFKRKFLSLSSKIIVSKRINPKYKISVVKYNSRGKSRGGKSRGTSLSRGISPPIKPRGISKIRRPSSPNRRIYSPPSKPKRPTSPPPYYPRGGSTPVKKLRLKFSHGQRKSAKLKKAIPTFNVYAKVGRKFVKINKGQLSRQDALNKGTYAVDNTIAKTFKITPAGRKKKVLGLPNVEKNYYKRAGYKLREYKIKRGRKFGVLPRYIEKKRYGIDTKGEKKGLSLARYVKGAYQKARVTRARKKLNKNSKAYKIKIKNLRKARKVLNRKNKSR